MELRVLGPIEVDGPDGTVAFRGRLGCLVAALGARRPRAVSVDVLVDDVFGEDLPSSAWSTMHGYVHRVRRRAPGLIESTPAGYRLEPEVSVDADGFDADHHAARDALSAGRPEEALECLDAALARWRGPAYGDYADRAFAEADAMRLEELRRATEDERLAVLVEVGEPESVLADLEAAVQAEPTRECRWSLLLRSLAAAGRPAEAREAADRYRRLCREWGTAPTAAFEAAEHVVDGPAAQVLPIDPRGVREEAARILAKARAVVDAVPDVPASVVGEAALETADRLVALGALDEADRWLGEVIARLGDDDPGRAARAHLARADVRAHRESADWLASVLAGAALAESLDDTELLVEAALLNPGWVATYVPGRAALLRTALERAGPDHRRRAVLLAQLASELIEPGTLDEHTALMDEALLEARRVGDDTTRGLVVAAVLNDPQQVLSPGERAELAGELDTVASRLGRGDAAWLAAAHRYYAAVQRAEPDEAAAALRAVVAREGGRRELGAVHRSVPFLRAIDAYLAGQLDEADELLTTSAGAGPPDDDALGVSVANRHGVLLRLRREQGRLGELVPPLSAPLPLVPALLAPSALALVHAELGDDAAARAALAGCRADDHLPQTLLPPVWARRLEAAALLGDQARACAEADRLRPYAGQCLCLSLGCDGAVDRYLGLAAAVRGDRRGADRWLTSALGIHERLRSPTLVARVLHDRAVLLGDRDAGRRSRALATRHGLTALAGSARPRRRVG